MIITVTLNPAVDKTCSIASIKAGEVNRLNTSRSYPGGKGINVAKVLKQFRMSVAALGFLGGYTGRFISEAVEEMGIECCFTAVEGDTRTNTNILGEDGLVTEILEPGPVIQRDEMKSFLKTFDDCLENCEMVVLSGSVPKGVPADIYSILITRCRLFGVPVMLDTSGEALKAGIEAKPDFIKPNKKELQYLVGRELATREDIVAEAKKLVADGIDRVVVSMGTEGMLYVDGENELFMPIKEVKTVNTVACGDTAVASMCMSILAGEEPEMALRKAVAMSAANASSEESGVIPMETYLALL